MVKITKGPAGFEIVTNPQCATPLGTMTSLEKNIKRKQTIKLY